MKQYAAQGDFKHKHERVTVKLSVLEFQDGGVHIYYAPALDLSGYGKTEKEARKSFDFVMEEFMAYTLKKGTLHKELRRLGWNIRSMKQHKIKVPPLEKLAENNEQISQLLNHTPNLKISQQTAEIPVFA